MKSVNLFTLRSLAIPEPSTTGVGSGAALGVVVSILLFSGQYGAHIAALLGAAVAGIALYALGRRSLAVAGILIGAVLAAVTSLLLVVDAQPMGVVLRWLIGSLNARTQSDWNQLWPWVILLIPAGLLCASRANVLVLGDTAATGLGIRPDRTRLLLLGIAVLAAATAITAAGVSGSSPASVSARLMASRLATAIINTMVVFACASAA